MSSVKIACLGDVMCGESFYCMGDGVASSLARYGRAFLDSEILDYIRSHDIAMCNIECVISDIGRNERNLRSSQLRARPEAAGHLASWGVKVANVANNHIMEHGRAAAVDTVKNLERAGIKAVGAGKDGLFAGGIGVAQVECKGQKIAFIGACFRDEKYAYSGGAGFDEILAAVRDLRRRGLTVIVSVHWGDELMDRPSARQKKMARELMAAGASLVVGHHPHVVQGFERIDGALTAYSLGNFIFSGMHPQTYWSVILTITAADGGVTGYDVRVIEKDGDHRPHLVKGDGERRSLREVERRCAVLSAEADEGEYEKKYGMDLKSLRASASRELRTGLIKKIHRIRPVYLPQVLWRPVQRRLGTW